MLVAVTAAVVQLAAVPLSLPLGWDEAVYASQVSPRVPAAYFSAPRARGISWLAAPAVLLTSSTPVLRGWMVLLSTVGLVAAFWPWRRLVGERVTAGAAAVFASLWVVQFYANEVMPNLYVAYGAVAAVGWFVRAARCPGPREAGAVAGSVAFAALMRPPDAVFLSLSLIAAAAAVRAWRRWVPVCAVLTGLVTGLLPWLLEAYTRYGGVLARLREGSDVQGGMRIGVAVGMQARALNGPLLCRPCHVGWSYPLLSTWWLALPLLVAGGLTLAARTGRRRGRPDPFPGLMLATMCAVALSAQYLFLLDYAAPRFLVPAYALLALPVTACAAGVVHAASRRRRAVAGLLAVVFASHLVGQFLVLERRVDSQVRSRTALQHLARRLHGIGLRPPCTLVGADVVPLAFHAGCASEALGGNNRSITVGELMRRAAGQPLAAAAHTPLVPDYARGWLRCSLTTDDGTSWYLFLAPAPAPAPPLHC